MRITRNLNQKIEGWKQVKLARSLESLLSKAYLRETSFMDRNKRIENLSVGDPVMVVKAPS